MTLFKNKLNRMQFIYWIVANLAIWILLVLFLIDGLANGNFSDVLVKLYMNPSSVSQGALSAFSFAFYALIFTPLAIHIWIMSKRIRDIGWYPLLAFLWLAPTINIAFLIVLMVWPGKKPVRKMKKKKIKVRPSTATA